MCNFEEKLQRELLGAKFLGGKEMANEIASIIGQDVTWDDTYINDGADEDEEDNYVMCALFDTDNWTIRVYFGDVTEEIGYVWVDEY